MDNYAQTIPCFNVRPHNFQGQATIDFSIRLLTRQSAVAFGTKRFKLVPPCSMQSDSYFTPSEATTHLNFEGRCVDDLDAVVDGAPDPVGGHGQHLGHRVRARPHVQDLRALLVPRAARFNKIYQHNFHFFMSRVKKLVATVT